MYSIFCKPIPNIPWRRYNISFACCRVFDCTKATGKYYQAPDTE